MLYHTCYIRMFECSKGADLYVHDVRGEVEDEAAVERHVLHHALPTDRRTLGEAGRHSVSQYDDQAEGLDSAWMSRALTSSHRGPSI